MRYRASFGIYKSKFKIKKMIETTQINNANLQDEKICHYRLWKNCGATCAANQPNGKYRGRL